MIYFCNNEGTIYECDIIQEGETFYNLQLKGTNIQKCVRKEALGKLTIEGICAKTKKEIKSAQKQKEEKLYKLWKTIYYQSDWKTYDDFKKFAGKNKEKELKRKDTNKRYTADNCYWE